MNLLLEKAELLGVEEWETHRVGRPELAALEFPTNISKFRPGPLLVTDGCPAKLEAQKCMRVRNSRVPRDDHVIYHLEILFKSPSLATGFVHR